MDYDFDDGQADFANGEPQYYFAIRDAWCKDANSVSCADLAYMAGYELAWRETDRLNESA